MSLSNGHSRSNDSNGSDIEIIDDDADEDVVEDKCNREELVTDDDDVILEDEVQVCDVKKKEGKTDEDGKVPEIKTKLPPRFMKQPVLRAGDKVYGLERGLKDPWREAHITKIEKHFGKTVVGLKFVPTERIRNRRKVIDEKVVQSKHVAYYDANLLNFNIPVGCRVIARTLDKSSDIGNFFYAGIVAEPPKATNKSRYLVFFDDGYAAYCSTSEVRLISYIGAGANTWAEVHPDNQKFIKHYIRNYPEFKMARLRESQLVSVEWNGFWWTARVKSVDCSMARFELIANGIQFDLWRGSCRILELYRENKASRALSLPKGTNEEYEGQVVQHEIPAKYRRKPRDYRPHPCNPKCVSLLGGSEAKEIKITSPLLLPFYHGWARGIEPNDSQRKIYYQAPCGHKMWNLDDIQKFITKLKTPYGVDCFCFDFQLNCFDEFQVSKKANFYIEDISQGVERVPISQINCVDEEKPPDVIYTNERILGKGVYVNTDSGFLVCCDCEDDCQDKQKCACYRLTFEKEPETLAGSNILFRGYQNRRLTEKYMQGIYECSKWCKCSKNCTNRLVQHGLKWKLQVFKTSMKGYAIRTLQDIPQGSFICVYTGELLSSRQANESGAKYGDEYLANIDFIEAAETHKDGYESEVVEPEPEQTKRTAGRSKANGKKSKGETARKGKKCDEKQKLGKGSKDTAGKRKRIIEQDDESEEEEPRGNENNSKTRTLFGPEEDSEIFAIDAKKIGNIGRYLNHSCDPNVFAQDVFLDTHDIRFPWVAFFASRYIRCGTELTWDYNYEVGMAEGKSMACNCGSVHCRRRLL